MTMLVMLMAMMVAFAVLARSEPAIASNQMSTAQALRLADSGLQLALWALTNSTHPSGNGINLASLAHNGSAAAGNYDGNHVVTIGTLGGATVLVTWDALNATYERTVTTVGWMPSKDGSLMNAHRKIQAIVQLGVVPPLDPPCVVCVAGEMQVNGSAAAFDSSSAGCPGATPPQYAIQTVQALQYNAHPTF